jgi:PAS domain S-box-containing protein
MAFSLWARAGEDPPLRVGVNVDYPPYEFVNPAGDPQGYDVDLIRAAGRVMGLKVEIRPGNWKQIREDFQQRRIDVLPGLLKSDDRSRWADFSEPHTVVQYSLFHRKDSPATPGLESLKGKRILVEEGSQMHEQLLMLGFAKEAVAVRSEPEALRRLAAGQADAALVPHLEGILQIQQAGLLNIHAAGSPLFSRELCFAVAPGNMELRSRLNTGLAILHRTGEYQQIYRKWFGRLDSPRASFLTILRYSLWVALPLVAGLMAILLWNRSLRQQVYRSTQRLRETNQALREQESMLNAVIDSLPLMLFVKDPQKNFCFTVWNAKTEELLGVPREKMLGKTDYDLLPAEQVESFRAADQAVLDSGRLLDIPEETVLSPVKGPVLLHTIKVPVLGEDGRPRFLLGISEDITSLRRMQSDLRRSQESLAEAQRIARLGSWEWTPGSGEMRWSEEFYRLLGRETGAFTPTLDHLLEHIHPEDREAFRAALEQATRTGSAATLDHRLLPVEGDEKLIYSRVAPRERAPGEPISLLGTCLDVTEGRRAEKALLQTQKLEGLGVLAGGMAHDFNNLLTVILGNLNLAQVKIDSGNPVHPYLDKVEATVLKASQLARQILAYSGRGSFVIRPLDINLVATDMAHLLDVSLSKKVRLVQELQPGLPAVEGDETQLQQVILNLVTNASEAIGDQEGRILMRTSLAQIGAKELAESFPEQDLAEGPFVVLEVQDTGCGIPKDIQQRIFEPFFTTKFLGRGLGLSAMRGILKGHHAGIQVTSRPGEGTCFRILLPAALSKAAAPETPAREGTGERRRGRILVVEDEPDLRHATAEMLHHLGYETVEAEDGMAALECVRREGEALDLILLDLTMPRMDGREALQEIQKIRPGARIVLCSGFDEQDALAGSEALGVGGFLAKPYRLQALKTMIEGVLRNPDNRS